MAQVEISSPLSVLDDTGRPVNFGWARKALFEYKALELRTPGRRIVASDRYIVFSSTHLISIQALDGGYLGNVGLSVVSLNSKDRSTQTYTIPFPLGGMGLPDSSGRGVIKIQWKHVLLEFAVLDGGVRIIKADFSKFGRRRYLRGELVLTPLPNAEFLVTHQPWPQDRSSFILSQRAPCYSVEGVVQHGSQEIVFAPNKGWGIFDWTRGSRPRLDLHWWAAACGLAGDDRVGFSVGYGAADDSLGTENGFFVNGRLHKLDRVTFHTKPASWLDEWHFTSSDNRLEMIFTPHQERVERNQMLFYSLSRRQVFGSFSGRMILDDGRELEFHDLTGVAEQRKSRN
jgi:hypothetical protein